LLYLDNIYGILDSVDQGLAEESVHGANDADEVVTELNERIRDNFHCGGDTVHDNVNDVARAINDSVKGVLNTYKKLNE
jgi:hypothetical protein